MIKSKRLRFARLLVRIEEDRSAFKILTGKPTGNRPLGRPWRRWEGTIRMDLKEIGVNTKNLNDLPEDRDYSRALMNAAFNCRVPRTTELELIRSWAL